MRIALIACLICLLAYGLLVAVLWQRQTSLVFPASTERVSAAEAGLAEFQDVWLETPDGERLLCWWKAPEAGRAVLIYFHGNGGSLVDRRYRARALTQDGRGLLLVSYRGYSGSTGTPSEAGLRIDAETAYRHLAAYAPHRIVFYGESLGSGVAVTLASTHEIGGLILDAPFTSITEIAKRLFWYMPVETLLRSPFRSIDRIGAVRAPLLVLHGERDDIVPIAYGEALFAAAPEPKRFVRLPRADHVSVLEHGGIGPVRTFLAEVEARLAAPPAAP